MNGDQLLARVKVKHPEIPVIMYSSQNSVEVVIRLMKLGAMDFIPKEKNFIKILSNMASKHINKIRTDYENRWMMRGMVFVFVAFLASLVAIRTYTPGSVNYFFIGVIGLLCILGFAAGSGSPDHKSSHIN